MEFPEVDALDPLGGRWWQDGFPQGNSTPAGEIRDKLKAAV